MSDWKAAYRKFSWDTTRTDAQLDKFGSDIINKECYFKRGYEIGYKEGRLSGLTDKNCTGDDTGVNTKLDKPPEDPLVAHVRERCLRLMDEAKRRGELTNMSILPTPLWGVKNDCLWGIYPRVLLKWDVERMDAQKGARIMSWLPRLERWAERQWRKQERREARLIRKARRRMMKDQGVIPASGKPFVRPTRESVVLEFVKVWLVTVAFFAFLVGFGILCFAALEHGWLIEIVDWLGGLV